MAVPVSQSVCDVHHHVQVVVSVHKAVLAPNSTVGALLLVPEEPGARPAASGVVSELVCVAALQVEARGVIIQEDL